MTNMKGRKEGLDSYKGALIILVVLRHVLQYSVKDEGGILTNFIWALQMPGFMLVAGYFSYKEMNSFPETGRRILKSLQHYALPFFAWGIVIDCILLGYYERDVVTAFSALVQRVDRGLWFLWVVFVLSIPAAFCSFAATIKNTKKAISAIGIVCLMFFSIAGLLVLKFGVQFLGMKFVLYYSVFYGAGWLLHKTENRWKSFSQKYNASLASIALAIFLAIVYNYDLYRCEDDVKSIVLRCIAGFSGNYALFWIILKNGLILKKFHINWLGMYTLEIYATHLYFVHCMSKWNSHDLMSFLGFTNFSISLFITALFTATAIISFKAFPLFNYLFFGKRHD